MAKAIFLDRDGVINKAIVRDGKPYPPSHLDELEIIRGVHEALRELKEAGYLLIVVTNQPDVARGTISKETVDGINSFLLENLPLDDIFVCFHDSSDMCGCRKPLPGLLLQATEEYDISNEDSFMIGDRWRDIEAGNKAGCRTIFIDYGYEEKQPDNYELKVKSLAEASKFILGEKL